MLDYESSEDCEFDGDYDVFLCFVSSFKKGLIFELVNSNSLAQCNRFFRLSGLDK